MSTQVEDASALERAFVEIKASEQELRSILDSIRQTIVVLSLVAGHEEVKSVAVASSYQGVRGVPALFSRSLFSELLELRGPEGARRILQQHAQRTLEIPFAAGAIDIDTPEDYARSFTVPA